MTAAVRSFMDGQIKFSDDKILTPQNDEGFQTERPPCVMAFFYSLKKINP